jgi:hypothetical protein
MRHRNARRAKDYRKSWQKSLEEYELDGYVERKSEDIEGDL